MNSKFAHQLEERFQWYRKFVEERAWHSAVIKLAEISHCLPYLPKDEQRAWTQRIRDEAVSVKGLAEAEAEIWAQVDRIRRILSIGNRWNAEEILLVLQTRIEIELSLEFLNKCLAIESAISLQDIDRDIEALSKSESHRSHFTWAVRKMKQNWGLPIHSKWLGEAVET
jgi:hypothetical protein